MKLSAYEKPVILEERIQDIIDRAEKPNEAVTRVWYDEYRNACKENEKEG